MYHFKIQGLITYYEVDGDECSKRVTVPEDGSDPKMHVQDRTIPAPHDVEDIEFSQIPDKIAKVFEDA